MESNGSLVAGIAVGVLLGLPVGGLGAFAVSGLPTDSVDPANPPATVQTATGCAPERTVGIGWLCQVASGGTYTLTANVTVSHAAAESVNGTFERTASGDYAFRIETASAGKSGQTPDCRTGSTAQVTASLPTDWRSVVIVVDNATVAAVANDGETGAELRTFAFGNDSAN